MKLTKKLSYSEAIEEIESNRALYKMLYVTRGMTARKVAENQNIAYDNNFQKALCRVFPKKMGWGGFRIGSGQKKKSDED